MKILMAALTILICTIFTFAQSINKNTNPVLTNTKINFQDTISIAGTVYHGNSVFKNGLILAFNIVDSTYRYTLTDSTGHYQFSHLSKGEYEVHVFGNVEDTYKPLSLIKTESAIDIFIAFKINMSRAESPNQLNVGPNPFNNELNITISDNTTDAIKFCILDMYGTVLSETKSVAPDTISLHTSHLSTGVYLLQIAYGNHTEICKIIKN